MQRENDGADYEQQDVLLREESWLRHECAKVAAEVTKYGGHPERARDVEKGLLEVAGLNKFELAA